MKDKLFAQASSNKVPRGCFVLMPFHSPYNEIYVDHIVPILTSLKINVRRADDVFSVRPVMNDIWEGINNAQFLLAELTGRNPNVFYELGLAHALGKPVILISQSETDIPFDIRSLRVIFYDHTPRGCKKLEESLKKTTHQLLIDLSNLTIGISGSYKKDDNRLGLFARRLGELLARYGYRIVSGGGRGIAHELLFGARTSSEELLSSYKPGLIRTFKPVGYTEFPAPPIGEVVHVGNNWHQCRESFVAEADVLIVIAGGQGTFEECKIALQNGVPLVILKGSGGTADHLFTELGPNSVKEILVVEVPEGDSLFKDPVATLCAEKVIATIRNIII